MDYTDINGKPVDISRKAIEHMKKIRKNIDHNEQEEALYNIKGKNCTNNKGF